MMTPGVAKNILELAEAVDHIDLAILPADLTVGELRMVIDLVGYDGLLVLNPRSAPRPVLTPQAPAVARSNADQVLALLQELKEPQPISALMEALGWKYSKTLHALKGLEHNRRVKRQGASHSRRWSLR